MALFLVTWLALTTERCHQDEKEGVKKWEELVVVMGKKSLKRNEKESHKRRKGC